MAAPVIPTLPIPPERGQDYATFTAYANAWVAALDGWTTQSNNLGSWMDSTASAVSTSETNAANSAVASATSATESENARDAALAAANFKGNWSDLAGALNKPASVYHNWVTWLLLSNLADVTSSEPSFTNSDWVSVSGFASEPIEITATGSVTPTKNTLYYSNLSGNATTTLPSASTFEGFELTFKKMDGTHTWTIASGDNIDGVASKGLVTQYSYLSVVSDGSTWNIKSESVEVSDPVVKSIPDTIVDITSSQTWTVPAGVGRIKVVAIGGGGDGGSITAGSGSFGCACGGGGGGGMSIKVIDVTPSDGVIIDITSGVASVSHTPSSTTMVANKGADGGDLVTGTSVGISGGGSGGSASGGDYNLTGGGGSAGAYGGATPAGGAGSAINGKRGYTGVSYTGGGQPLLSLGANFWFDSVSLNMSLEIDSLNARVIQYYSLSNFSSFLLGIPTGGANARVTTTGISFGTNGLFGRVFAVSGSGGGSETGSGSGAVATGTGAWSGGNGGNIGAGGGGASSNQVSSTVNGGTGGAAHVFIVY
jgi:hypothetical protein